MTLTLSTVEIPPTAPQRGSVIWMHGLGADGHDFEPVVPHLERPDLRFVFPNAPQLPVTINGGLIMPAWYDIRSMGPGPDRESEEHIRRSAEGIEALIRKENERGVATEDIVLAGFSQGGAMALHTGLRHPQRLKGILVLSAYLVLENTVDDEKHEANADTPILFCHGTRDPMVPHFLGKMAVDRIAAGSNPVTFRDYPMGHEMCLEEIHEVRDWLAELYAE